MDSWICYVSVFVKVRVVISCIWKSPAHPFSENDTLARIGTSCFQQLLENNVRKLSVSRWERVVTAFVRLFKTTTPHQLFDESLSLRIDQNAATETPDSNGVL